MVSSQPAAVSAICYLTPSAEPATNGDRPSPECAEYRLLKTLDQLRGTISSRRSMDRNQIKLVQISAQKWQSTCIATNTWTVMFQVHQVPGSVPDSAGGVPESDAGVPGSAGQLGVYQDELDVYQSHLIR